MIMSRLVSCHITYHSVTTHGLTKQCCWLATDEQVVLG
jgi:hypothetical protein